MNVIFKEKQSIGPLPTKESTSAHIGASVRAAYDDTWGVLCIDLLAEHVGGCEDDGTPVGCRFCHPKFPLEKRILIDLGEISGDGTSVAIRRTLSAADAFYLLAEELRRSLVLQQRINGEVSGG